MILAVFGLRGWTLAGKLLLAVAAAADGGRLFALCGSGTWWFSH